MVFSKKPKTASTKAKNVKVTSLTWRLLLLKIWRAIKLLLILLILIGCFYFVGSQGKTWFENKVLLHEKFLLEEANIVIDIEGGLRREEVLAISGILQDKSLLKVNANKVETRLLKLPQVVSVKVAKVFPNQISIYVKQRVPQAWISSRELGIEGRNWQYGFLLDVEGYVFKADKDFNESILQLPIIELPVLPDDLWELKLGSALEDLNLKLVLALIDEMQEPLAQRNRAIDRVTFDLPYKVIIYCANGLELHCDYFEPERQTQNLIKILDGLTGQKTPKLINLIPKRNIPVIFEDE
mgnify:CR=1 FL=1